MPNQLFLNFDICGILPYIIVNKIKKQRVKIVVFIFLAIFTK